MYFDSDFHRARHIDAENDHRTSWSLQQQQQRWSNKNKDTIIKNTTKPLVRFECFELALVSTSAKYPPVNFVFFFL